MPKAEFNPNHDRFTRGIIHRKVKQLIGRANLAPQDREDLEQDLFVRVLQSLPRFNPDVAHRNKFITTVVERHVANILRNKSAQKRDPRRVSSLTLTIEATQRDVHLGRRGRSDQELAELAMDLAVVTATLPERWRTFLELRKTLTMTEVAIEMGVPRTTLYSWIPRIRRRFEKKGLKDYLES